MDNYIIVTAKGCSYYDGCEELVKKVNNRKNQGYNCVGGFNVTLIREPLIPQHYLFAQAMEKC